MNDWTMIVCTVVWLYYECCTYERCMTVLRMCMYKSVCVWYELSACLQLYVCRFCLCECTCFLHVTNLAKTRSGNRHAVCGLLLIVNTIQYNTSSKWRSSMFLPVFLSRALQWSWNPYGNGYWVEMEWKWCTICENRLDWIGFGAVST